MSANVMGEKRKRSPSPQVVTSINPKRKFDRTAEQASYKTTVVSGPGGQTFDPVFTDTTADNIDDVLFNALADAIPIGECTNEHSAEPCNTHSFPVNGNINIAVQPQPNFVSHASAPNGPRLHNNIT